MSISELVQSIFKATVNSSHLDSCLLKQREPQYYPLKINRNITKKEKKKEFSIKEVD